VKNCPKDWTHEDLYEHFIDANSATRGDAFVTFESSKIGQRAIQESNGLSHAKLSSGAIAQESDDQPEEPHLVVSDQGNMSRKVITLTLEGTQFTQKVVW
jgi:RNA recognition motif-containing protein